MARNRRGKIIETWVFLVHGTRVKVQVRMRVSGSDSRTYFSVRDPAYELDEDGEDINALRQTVESALKARHALDWQRMLHINFRGTEAKDVDEPDGDNGRLRLTLELSVTEIEVASRPDGSQCHRNYSERGTSTIYDGAPEEGRTADGWRNDVYAVVPATAENRRALRAVAKELGQGVTDLYQNLDPKNVENFLREFLDEHDFSAPTPRPPKKKKVKQR